MELGVGALVGCPGDLSDQSQEYSLPLPEELRHLEHLLLTIFHLRLHPELLCAGLQDQSLEAVDLPPQYFLRPFALELAVNVVFETPYYLRLGF